MPDELKVKQSVIRLTVEFIIDLDVDAVVYYARPDLALGSGFGAAIATKGGPKIQEELKRIGGSETTEAVITSGGNLKAKHIIHAVGPRFQEEDLEEKLRCTTLNALRRAEENKIHRLAFPAMGAGFYGVPLEVCARVTLEAAKKYLEESRSLREVIFCLRDSREYKSFQAQMEKMQLDLPRK
jgi:O-acetyl-ADP-ribose deacetylase (regulator of RNase III)